MVEAVLWLGLHVRLWLTCLHVVFPCCCWLYHGMVVESPEWVYRNGNKKLPHFQQSLRSHSMPCPLRPAAWEWVIQARPQLSRGELDFTLEDVLKRLQGWFFSEKTSSHIPQISFIQHEVENRGYVSIVSCPFPPDRYTPGAPYAVSFWVQSWLHKPWSHFTMKPKPICLTSHTQLGSNKATPSNPYILDYSLVANSASSVMFRNYVIPENAELFISLRWLDLNPMIRKVL